MLRFKFEIVPFTDFTVAFTVLVNLPPLADIVNTAVPACNGVIVTDNLFFHGLVLDENLIETKNQRGIVRKIKSFIEFLDNNSEFDTEYVSVGDGIAISKRKE